MVRSQDKDFTRQDKKLMAVWLEEDMANREAFEEMGGVWEHIGVLGHVFAPEKEYKRPEIFVRQRKAERFTGLKALLSWFSGSSKKVALAGGALALLVLLCLPGLKTYFSEQPETIHAYKTKIGEQKTLTLSDGSVLKMNVKSALSVLISNRQRQVELRHGEVFFMVTVDPDRPFEVRIPNGLVRVMGTAFNVRSRSGRVAVDVERGRVLVKDAPKGPGDMRAGGVTLAADQGVNIDSSGRLSRLRPSDMKQVLAWQNRQAVFKNTPLGEVLQELELYHDVRVKLALTELKAKGITGIFDMHDLDQTLEVIMAATSLQSKRQADGTIILYK